MADAAPVIKTEKSGSRSKAENPPTKPFAESLTCEWYIRVKAEFRNNTPSNILKSITQLEQTISELQSSLQNLLSSHEVQLWPQRLVDGAGKSDRESSTKYWLVGLPTIPSAELSSARKALKGWLDESTTSQRVVQAKFVPRKLLVEQNFEEDAQNFSSSIEPEEQTRQTGGNFKKIKGSNPGSVRKQFLHHAMSSSPASSNSTNKLRPARDVLNRLKYDAGSKMEDYVVGYIDRQAGILEKPVGQWEVYAEEELIAYFKHVSDGLIVWDRAKKVDCLFNALP